MDKKYIKSRTNAYMVGFFLSIILTAAAYFLVIRHVYSDHELLSHRFLSYSVIGLAVVQLIVQLVFFLHVGREPRPMWNLQALIFGVSVVLIVVVGSLWIMANLDYNHQHNQLDPSEKSEFIQDEEAIYR